MKTTDEDLKLEDSTLLAQVNGDGVEGASNLKVEDDSNAVEATVVTEENDASAGVETKGQGEDPETMGLAMMDVDEATAKTTDVTVTMV